jgi:hypothetical protein
MIKRLASSASQVLWRDRGQSRNNVSQLHLLAYQNQSSHDAAGATAIIVTAPPYIHGG